MSSQLPDEIINRLTKSLLGIFGHNTQQVEEIVISDEDDGADDQESNDNDSSSDDLTIISSSEEQVQRDRNDVYPSVSKDSAINKENDESTKADGIDDITKDGESSKDDCIDGDGAYINEESSHCEDGNESDVIDLFDDDEDLFKKLDGQPMICNRCYPIMIFRKKSLYIIHRIRHFAEDHYVCPICHEGFVKLMYCVSHELRVHKEETQLNDQGFASAISAIFSHGKHSSIVANTQNNSEDGSNKTEKDKDIIYSDYAIASSSLYPYSGPPVETFANTYDIHYKYGRPRPCLLNSLVRSVKTWRSQYEAYARETIDTLPPAPNIDIQNNSSSDACVSDSSFTSLGIQKKRKKYRKTVKKRKKPEVKAYCCNVCSFTSNSDSDFKEHSKREHPNFTDDQVLEYFVLPSLGRYSPVRKKRTSFGPPPKKRTRYAISDDSADESIHESCSLSSSPPRSLIAQSAGPDCSTKDGFCSSLGLIRTDSSK